MEPTIQIDKLEHIHRQVHKMLLIEWNRISGPLELSMAQANLLKFLDSVTPHKTSEVADFMCITSGALTMLCDKLAEKGLIERKRDESDRRIVYLELSDRGRQVVEKIKALKEKLFQGMFEGIPAEDLQTLDSLYSRIAANLSRMPENGTKRWYPGCGADSKGTASP
ncbi:MarR family transcriptional regulator [Paenibacillus sp. P26]|nr:MarR family transcriptional regulator [Paenibacillus sp. P26]UUZ92761.1 MarR family transcriptional regulator [Paenibacillus sp. P25]